MAGLGKSYTLRLESQRPRYTADDRDDAKFARWDAVERARGGEVPGTPRTPLNTPILKDTHAPICTHFLPPPPPAPLCRSLS